MSPLKMLVMLQLFCRQILPQGSQEKPSMLMEAIGI
jgi:hypothetical protein